MEAEYRLEMKNITKHFGGVKALTNVSFSVRPGEIHALVGENGAGKSTLMKILSGAYKRDAGEICIDGESVNINSPKNGKDLGIAVIYQEFMLAQDLTVAENIFIDQLTSGRLIINWSKLRKRAEEQLGRLGFEDIRPVEKVGNLSVAYQQVVEICKNLTGNAKVLVLDEPTAVLTFTEIEKLFAILKKLKEENVSIIYISHRLEEVFEISDRITVLKDGECVGTVAADSVDKESLAKMMVGRELKKMFPERKPVIGEEILRVNGLKAGKMVQDVSFYLRKGEILGFSGIVGAGRTETMRAVFGVDAREQGEVFYFGKKVKFKHCREAIREGLGLLPEDRKKQGLLLRLPIRDNVTLTVLYSKIANKLGMINPAKEKKYAKELLDGIHTKYGSMEDFAGSLSGGNQQKVALAKWIAADCRCIILDEPTRGVDVGSKAEIYKLMNELAAKGIGIIMISSEMTELIGMCDRIMVMRNGKISGEFLGDEIGEDNLIKAAMGV